MRPVSEELNEVSYATIGAAMEVHRELGPGHLESVYSNALKMELGERGIAFEKEAVCTVSYKGREVGRGRMDFIVEGCVVVEVKAVSRLVPQHEAQILSYLVATGNELGLLLNFCRETLKKGLERVVYTG